MGKRSNNSSYSNKRSIDKHEKKQKRQKYSHNPQKKGHLWQGKSSPEIVAESAYKRQVVYPSPCIDASNYKGGFVTPDRDEPLYQALVKTSYEGFVKDPPDAYKASYHAHWREAFQAMDREGLFQYDMTQPAGLGAKVAKTFVTRCLVGEPGITYKYLGLRMFSHPWTKGEVGASKATEAIFRLNDTLRRRSEMHLKALGRDRVGPTNYNLTLINRCRPMGEMKLKDEPYYPGEKGPEKCTVSWHADSSLVHYSSIGVYQMTVTDDDENSRDMKRETRDDAKETPETKGSIERKKAVAWRVALRVAPDSEGPTASKLKEHRAGGHAEAAATPAIAVPLENGASYHLLDDFNHHHQHCVLAGSCHRWASTHRVGRVEGHSFQWVVQRAKHADGGPRRDGAKQLRSEQSILSEVEFEWLRQYYIQGQRHHELHTWWHGPMEQLRVLWESLERRTAAVLKDLEAAAEGEAVLEARVQSLPEEGERRKATKKLVKMVQRLQTVELESYDVMETALVERRVKRKGFIEREKDAAFATLPECCHPLPATPRLFAASYHESEGLGSELSALANAVANIRTWRAAFKAKRKG